MEQEQHKTEKKTTESPALSALKDNQMRITELVDLLNTASDAYYNGKNELMSDHEWDAAFDELQRLENETGFKLPNSPTNNVSADDLAGKKETHEFPMLSLAKTKKVADLVKWAEGRSIWLSWKLDGLTLVATYDNGQLTKLVTRGNGQIGTNITHLSSAIQGVLPTISYKGHLVIRGEAVISYDNFNRFNLEADEAYANPRNLASGSLALKDATQVKERNIEWIPFTLLYSKENFMTWGKQMMFLAELGFNVIEHAFIPEPTIENIGDCIEKWSMRVNGKKGGFPYPVDGLVICYDDIAYAAGGSVTGHHATRGGYAFKWQDESAETELEEIEWSCAASTISPVAVFRPVELEGTTVRRASLCNISECERLGIGGKGTRIAVIKANKIIPKIIHVNKRIGELFVPENCPVCQAKTEIIISEIGGTKTLHCTNSACPAKQLKKMTRFVSKEGVNIDGLSEQTIQKFINLGWVSDYADLFHLADYAETLKQMDGFGKRSVDKLLQSIEAARNIDAQQLLFALNIPDIGRDACKRLLAAYPFEELITKATQHPNTQSLFGQQEAAEVFSHISGIGPKTSESLVKWMSSPINQNSLTRLRTELNVSQTSIASTGQRCEGLTFVITGDVHHYKNRNELKAYIESQGGKVAGSISKSTNFLINNNVESTSGKNQKALQLNIPIISEDKFIEDFVNET